MRIFGQNGKPYFLAKFARFLAKILVSIRLKEDEK